MRVTSLQTRARFGSAIGSILIAASLGSCSEESYNPCVSDIGVCPRPEPGVVVNDIGMVKAVWAEDSRIGTPLDNDQALCAADLDRSAGIEVAFRGENGVAIISAGPTESTTLEFLECSYSDSSFIDLELDGDAEYVCGGMDLVAHDGSALWTQSPGPFRGGPTNDDNGDWELVDVDNDGDAEFAITTEEGIELIAADGSVLDTIGDHPYDSIEFADVDGDGTLELVAYDWHPPLDSDISTLTLDGVLLASFDHPDPHAGGITTSRRSGDNSRDYIRVACRLYDIDGTLVEELPEDDAGKCTYNDVDYGAAFMIPCWQPRGADDDNELSVRFLPGQEPFRIQLTYSFESTTVITIVSGYTETTPTRTIVKVYDPDNALVYHEVIASNSGPRSALVIPAEREGVDVFLLAKDTQILSFRLDTGPSSD